MIENEMKIREPSVSKELQTSFVSPMMKKTKNVKISSKSRKSGQKHAICIISNVSPNFNLQDRKDKNNLNSTKTSKAKKLLEFIRKLEASGNQNSDVMLKPLESFIGKKVFKNMKKLLSNSIPKSSEQSQMTTKASADDSETSRKIESKENKNINQKSQKNESKDFDKMTSKFHPSKAKRKSELELLMML